MDVMRLPGIFEISKALTMQRDGMHAFWACFCIQGVKLRQHGLRGISFFLDEIDDKQCHQTVRRKNRFAAHVFMSVFRPRETNFFTQAI